MFPGFGSLLIDLVLMMACMYDTSLIWGIIVHIRTVTKLGFLTHLSSRNKYVRPINFHIHYLTPAKILALFLFVYLFVFIVCCFFSGKRVTGK